MKCFSLKSISWATWDSFWTVCPLTKQIGDKTHLKFSVSLQCPLMPVNSQRVSTFTEIFQIQKNFGWKIEIFSVTLVPIDARQFPQSTNFHWNFSVSKPFWLKNWNFQFHISSHWCLTIPAEYQLSLKFFSFETILAENWNFQCHFSSHWYLSVPTEYHFSLKYFSFETILAEKLKFSVSL